MEREFKTSLFHLCNLYQLTPPAVQGLFPMNIGNAFKKVKDDLEGRRQDLNLKIILDDSAKVSIATAKVFDTRMTLYYLPLAGIWEMMKLKDKKPETALLLSLLAYLYQIAGVPHFAENYSYLGEIYEVVAEWNCEEQEEEDEQADRDFIAAHYSLLSQAGEVLLSLMADKRNLQTFKGRVQRFRPKDRAGEDLLRCAKDALKLYQAFPRRSVMDKMEMPILQNEGDNFIRPEQYIGFYWSNTDCMIDNVMDYVNAELNELCEMEEPVSTQYFDAPQTAETHGFAFEEKFFALLHQTTDLLNNLP